jgi:hypothetical protein
VVPELMQDDCTPHNLCDAVLHWLRNPAAAAALVPRFRELHAQLRCDASARAADAVAELLESHLTHSRLPESRLPESHQPEAHQPESDHGS